MTKRGAAVGTLIFLVTMPGVMGGLLPYWLTGWDSTDPPVVVQVIGWAALIVGLGILAHTVIRFVVEGVGTPTPIAPTQNLVVGGLYRFVRNPMYLGVIAILLGQAAILGRTVLVVTAALFWALVASFVRFYEEPTLAERYGTQYAVYRHAVRAWWPRFTPWNGESPGR